MRGKEADAVEGGERLKKRPKLGHEGDTTFASQSITMKEKWEPTEEEIAKWNRRVMAITSLAESEARKKERASVIDDGGTSANDTSRVAGSCKQRYAEDNTKVRDRSGDVCLSYRESLPPFLAAAADGDLGVLRKCIEDDGSGADSTPVMEGESQALRT